MTTKFKIIAGFTIMILLLGGIAVTGYFGLQSTGNGFVSYRWSARANISASDMVGAMNDALLKTFDFMRRADLDTMEGALKSADDFGEFARAAEAEATDAYRKEAFANMNKQVPGFKAAQISVRDSLLALNRQYDEIVRPAYRSLEKLLQDLGDSARSQDNYEALHTLTIILGQLSHSMNALGSFSQSLSRADQKDTHDRLIALESHLAKLEPQLRSSIGRAIFSEVMKAEKTMTDAVEGMNANAEALRASILDLRKYEKEITDFMSAFNSRVDREMRATGTQILEEIDGSQKQMGMVSLVGVLAGALLAALTIFGIIRVLNDLSGYARAIAGGNFLYQVRTKEKGEIGAVVHAMHEIPDTLKQVIDKANMLANDIRVGLLRNRLHETDFPGSFSNLAVAINTVGNAFTDLVDNLPIPIMACGKDCSTSFLNKIGQSVVGGDLIGRQCAELINTPACNKDACLGKRCMSAGSPVTEELEAAPQGQKMNISVTAMPLADSEGVMSAFVEVITDLTEIRTKQRIMLDVAHQAAEISNRVAAASEELSAQVEQVSRGAEMQRERVESTASAMTEMNSTVLEVARSAGEASEQSDNTRAKANDGATLVNKVVQAINQVNTVAVTLQGNMQELGGQAENIGGVMNVISDIADQTNLLALNAAIEAARAGEAGRGFAVVADEVRKLAEKTMEATHEVGSSIAAIQNSARTNIEEVGNAVSNIHAATDLANSSGEALKEIVNLASSNSAVVASIATAAEEQSATSEEINRAIEEINHVVGETTEGMIQSSAAVQELSQMAQELRRVMEGLK
ncbi:methyl-accepting chemotaxis protein [Desulfovibrio sp. OttesenSCG-928-G11]|nr:methyl-accepting chemotaxis protein [Desulfovibrio sp. OttesenSCG-928-G11]